MNIRNVKASDYKMIIPVINEWWNGRQMADMLPKLFFDYFQNTSYIVEENEKVIGFLIGFLSQTNNKEAYIHFVGLHPQYRQHGIGRKLYETFFDHAKRNGVETVRCVTSPVNKVSIAFHTKIGFAIEKNGEKEMNGVAVHTDYDGPNQDRVLFVKTL
ncbi:GNAT family N-acetyltransferase [Paenibacillus apiarius]|uniref:GNAT family N-acetyltransferase n=1 Tax=Paenibacillus apiarius TaxID=46240 RepID=UPI00197D421B|nr:GNAT family N-acetyltransferase [Paenibacillus apiarius]MBN3526736.1 GNAT family N-acetyltransferase [Paenibacillus apiarius]